MIMQGDYNKSLTRSAKYSIFIFILFCRIISFGQNNGSLDKTESSTENALSKAQVEFDKGHYLSIRPILDKQFDFFVKREKVDAFQLMGRTHIELDEADSARKSIFKILELDPLYTPPDDVVQEDFIRYYKEIDVRPLFTFSFQAGVNTVFIQEQDFSPIFQGEDYDEKATGKTGWQMALLANYFVSKKVSIESGLGYNIYNYSKSYQFAEQFSTFFEETLNYFSIPLKVKWHEQFNNSPVSFSLFTGPDFWFLNNSASSIALKDQDNVVNNENIIFNKNAYQNSSYLQDIDLEKVREKVLPAWVFGVGFAWIQKRSELAIQFEYVHSFKNVNKTEGLTLPEDDLGFYYYHSDSGFKINPLKFSLSYTYRIKYHLKQND